MMKFELNCLKGRGARVNGYLKGKASRLPMCLQGQFWHFLNLELLNSPPPITESRAKVITWTLDCLVPFLVNFRQINIIQRVGESTKE